ncbi:MAG: HEPN domain-containing protein [Ardenticatenales bacterium]|nr:HEPN domain-containing protein [Ardenticatenales bacterium]
MPNRANDWYSQAERDLALARSAAADGFHEWACFAAHQAAEKAVKAIHLHHGQEAWGHSVGRLLSELPEVVTVPSELGDSAQVLDTYYIPPRYPDSHPEGSPWEHYGPLQSREAVEHAGAIVEFARPQVA